MSKKWKWVALGLFFFLTLAPMAIRLQQLGTELRADGTAVAVDTSSLGALKHPDAAELELWSEAAGVPAAYTFAVAWEETRNNTDPYVRGTHGEWGRFQIMESTARLRCSGLNIRDYHGNLACFLRMALQDYHKYGSWRSAALSHNGRGKSARDYAGRVMGTVRMIVNSKVGAV